MSLFKAREHGEENKSSSNISNTRTSKSTSKFNKKFLAILLTAGIAVGGVGCAKEQTQANNTLPDTTTPAATETIKETTSVTVVPDSQNSDMEKVSIVSKTEGNNNSDKEELIVLNIRKDILKKTDFYPDILSYEQKKEFLIERSSKTGGYEDFDSTTMFNEALDFQNNIAPKYADRITECIKNKDGKTLLLIEKELQAEIDKLILLVNKEEELEKTEGKSRINQKALINAMHIISVYNNGAKEELGVSSSVATTDGSEIVDVEVVVNEEFIKAGLHQLEIEENAETDEYVKDAWEVLNENQQELMLGLLQIEFNKNPNAPFGDTFLVCKTKVLNAEKMETEAIIKDLEDRIARGEKLDEQGNSLDSKVKELTNRLEQLNKL